MKSLEEYMEASGFRPNDAQREAILHGDGPLYLPAGPGSGKTRVLLWRTFNLVVFKGVDPSRIFLSTFTDKAAQQLRNGLTSLFSVAGAERGRPYDTAGLYVGTLHSLSSRLLSDPRFSEAGVRPRPPILMDELEQFLYLYRGNGYRALLARAAQEHGLGTAEEFSLRVQACFRKDPAYSSRYEATDELRSFFNRVSEEAPVLADWEAKAAELGMADYHRGIRFLLDLYGAYLRALKAERRTDLSLIQREAYDLVAARAEGEAGFGHVIIDEYQDTNTIQEKLVFALAGRSRNLCVVGDDDQALYRFRGATVENFVRFPERVRERWGVEARAIPITRNYRSRPGIVSFCASAIQAEDWTAADGKAAYRVEKRIEANRPPDGPAVHGTAKMKVEDAAAACAELVERLLASGKVEDPNRIAFLFPSVTSSAPKAYIAALEARGIKTYAPRAGSFLETEESTLVFGLIGSVIGFSRGGRMNDAYRDWTHRAEAAAQAAIAADPALAFFVKDRSKELARAAADYGALGKVVELKGWDLKGPYEAARMKRSLAEAPGISEKAKRSILSRYFDLLSSQRAEAGKPFSLDYVISRATALDWSLLDLFYQLCAFDCLKRAFDLAEGSAGAVDEGPICNLSMVSGYLARYGEEYHELISAQLAGGLMSKLFFGQFLFLLFKAGESEYEDPEDPFPRGRVPFLTIHQSKGLEFPVVFVPNTTRRARARQADELIDPFLPADREPAGRRAAFDEARKFYVAFSRAENLLVIPRSPYYAGKELEPFLSGLPDIQAIDLGALPEAKPAAEDLPRNYSYTGDFTFYAQCPRRYMAFRKYGFSASRTQHQVFGNLVHRTIEDLHRKLLAERGGSP